MDLLCTLLRKGFLIRNVRNCHVMSGIESGIDIDKINVALKLVILKPLNAPLIIQLYNHMISTEGRAIIIECWQWAGILEAVGAVGTGEKDLPQLDPFHDINLLLESFGNYPNHQRKVFYDK